MFAAMSLSLHSWHSTPLGLGSLSPGPGPQLTGSWRYPFSLASEALDSPSPLYSCVTVTVWDDRQWGQSLLRGWPGSIRGLGNRGEWLGHSWPIQMRGFKNPWVDYKIGSRGGSRWRAVRGIAIYGICNSPRCILTRSRWNIYNRSSIFVSRQ